MQNFPRDCSPRHPPVTVLNTADSRMNKTAEIVPDSGPDLVGGLFVFLPTQSTTPLLVVGRMLSATVTALTFDDDRRPHRIMLLVRTLEERVRLGMGRWA